MTAKASGEVKPEGPKPGHHPAHIGGSPDEILEKLDKIYQEVGGWDELNCIVDNGGIPGEEVLASITCLGEKVLPRLHQIDGKAHNAEAAERKAAEPVY